MNSYALYNTKRDYRYRKTACRMKKQLCTAILFFAIVLTGIIAGSSLLKTYQAKASNAYEEVVYYKSIRISEGDTLWTIADEYMGNKSEDKQSYIEEVKRLNHLNGDTIHTGSYLMIPYTEIVSEL